MSFLAEFLAVTVVWLSSVALGQFGVALDQCPRAKPTQARTVSRLPREPIQSPVAATPRAAPAPTAWSDASVPATT